MQAKGNDATVTFDDGWLTIRHTGLGAIARGGTRPIRIHVKSIGGVGLTEPRMFAGWFTVVPAYGAPTTSPVKPYCDPLTVRFSARSLRDLETIRTAIEDAMSAIHEGVQEPAAQQSESCGRSREGQALAHREIA